MTNREISFRVAGFPDPRFEGIEINLGRSHPAHAGLLTGSVTLTDGLLSRIDPQPGALHRGVEMIFQARDYRQCLSLANRHDWQAPFFGEWALAILVEEALGVEVPPRAQWLRAALAEHTRISSHLTYLSYVGHRLGDPELATDGVRERLRARMAELTGNRLHPMAVRLGGIACEPTPAWEAAEVATLAEASELAERVTEALDGGLGAGLAVVDAAAVNAHGLAGPTARASGLATDLRRGWGPYAEHGDLLQTGAPVTGDAAARFRHWAGEVRTSAALVARLLGGLPSGGLRAHLPKVVKLPEGDHTSAVEAPQGRAGMVVTSRGDKTPWRLRLRTPAFAHVSAWPAVLPGTPLADLDTALASLPWVAGDLDK